MGLWDSGYDWLNSFAVVFHDDESGDVKDGTQMLRGIAERER